MTKPSVLFVCKGTTVTAKLACYWQMRLLQDCIVLFQATYAAVQQLKQSSIMS